MVFSSIPAYLDPPNWQQQPNQVQHQEANGSDSSQLLTQLPLQQHAQAQAQQAKIQPPETALKCPRCESPNTKFCYFNNYSLSQPRHFCKTCRRYWTRGGALRNVPVGGGYRRNKKSKRTTRSKSPVSNEKESPLSNSTSAIFTPTHMVQFPQPTNGPNYMTSLQNLSRYGVGNNIGLNNLREIQAQTGNMGFQIGVPGSTAGEGGFFQQFPFFNGFESTSSAVSYPFQSEIVEAPTSRVTQNPSVKMEYNGGLNLSRSHLNISENNHYNSWGGTDLSAFASSSASHLL